MRNNMNRTLRRWKKSLQKNKFMNEMADDFADMVKRAKRMLRKKLK